MGNSYQFYFNVFVRFVQDIVFANELKRLAFFSLSWKNLCRIGIISSLNI